MATPIEVEPISKNLAVKIIQEHHYSKTLPRLTNHYLGIFENGGIQGVITLGWGTQPLQTIKKIFPDEDGLVSTDYTEIGRMCFLPNKNADKQFGSQAMSAVVKWLKKNTDYKILYTMADGIMGKAGYVYQASNFHYIGNFQTSVYRDIQTGEKIHPRSAKTLLIENAEWEGKEKVSWLTLDFCKYKGIDKINGLMFRYVYPLNKKGKKMLKKIKTYPHPKDKDLIFRKRVREGKFVDIEQPEFNMNVLEHNYQKHNDLQLVLF